MMQSYGRRRSFRVSAILGALFVTTSAADAATTDYIDLNAGLGFASNPFLSIPTRSSAFGRISVNGVHAWSTERSTSSLTAYLENTTYFKDYGSKQIFELGAHTNRKVSPTVTVFGDLGFAGDFAGQLSNRLIFEPTQPVPPVPGSLPPPIIDSPDLSGLSGRQYRVSGQAGASIQAGARGRVSLTAGAQRSWFTGSQRDADYNSYFASAGYSQQVSERTSAGANFSVQRQDYRHGNWANIFNPALTVQSQLTENISANASFGVIALEQRMDGQKDRRVSPSFSGSLCNINDISQLCARVSRDAQSALSSRVASGSGGAAITTTASVDYSRRLSADGTLQAGLSAVRYDTPAGLDGNRFRTTYLSGVVGYDRKIRDRIFAGVTGGVRKLFQNGPDPNLDLNANVYLRYRLGDLQ